MLWRSSRNSLLAQLADFTAFYFSYAVAYLVWDWMHGVYQGLIPRAFPVHAEHYVIVAALSLICVILFHSQGAYSYQRFTSLVTEYFICLKVSALNFVLGVTLIFLLGYRNIPRTILLLGFLISLVFSILQKTALFYGAHHIRKKGKNRKRILLVGTGTRAKHFIETVKENFGWGLDVVGLLSGDQEKVGKKFYGHEVIGMNGQIEEVLKTVNPEEVVITISTKRFDQIREILECCEREGVQVRLNSDFFGHITKNVKIDKVYGLNIISFSTTPESESKLIVKRLMDIVLSSIAFLVLLPIMVIAAIGILLADGRPIIYEWHVVGLNKKPFKSWKFRTMCKDADDIKGRLKEQNEMSGPVFKIRDDPRIFPFGRWLRKFSIDETPQLLSVLRGDMSMVGPRPAGVGELPEYESWHRRKLSVKPGLTCLWQVSGRNRISDFDDWVRLDLEYIDNWSLWLDFKILIKTIPAVINGRGAS